MKTLAIVTAVLGLLLGAGTASAATTRVVAPSGSGTTCTTATPCTLQYAFSVSTGGDAITVTGGSYSVASDLTDPTGGVTVNGVAGASRPTVTFGTNHRFNLFHGSTIRDLDIVGSSNTTPLSIAYGTIAERLSVRNSGGDAISLGFNVVLSDTVVVSSATRTIFLECNGCDATATLRNVTAINTGSNGAAIVAQSDDAATGSSTINAYNVIARSTGSSGVDVRATSPGSPATVHLTNSAYATTEANSAGESVTGSGTVAGAPQFVSPTDFHELATSPTVDAGADDAANGTLDLDGGPRTLGDRTDIGAYEITSPPKVTTSAAGGVTTTGATLSGTVDAQGSKATPSIQWGTDASYGNLVLLSPVSGTDPTAVSTVLSGLTPGTTYHYRVVATNDGGTTTGPDQAFTTATPPIVTPPAAPAAPKPAAPAPTAPKATFAGSLSGRTFTVKGGKLVLPLTCSAACSVSGTLKAGTHAVATLKTVKLKTKKRTSVTIKIGASGLKRLARGKHVKVAVRLTVKTASSSASKTYTVTLIRK